MNAITSIRDVQNALSGETSHEALVSIAAFATTHLQEMSGLESGQKNELFSRLVTETYDNKELKAVTTLAEQFFKEQLGDRFDEEGLSHLSQTERLHLFRYVNQSKLSTSHASSLMKMSKRKRERIIYRAMLTPLLRERVQGKELEDSIQKCISFLQGLPESKREEHLQLFKKYLPLLPAIKSNFTEVLRFLHANADKIHHLEKVGHKLTDQNALKSFFYKKTEENPSIVTFEMLTGTHFEKRTESDLACLEMLLDIFPDLDPKENVLSVGVNLLNTYPHPPILETDNTSLTLYAPLCKLIKEIPLLSKCQTAEEICMLVQLLKHPPSAQEKFKSSFQRLIQTFPKLNSGYGYLLAAAEQFLISENSTNETLKTLEQEPFIHITSGEKLAFFIKAISRPGADIELLKRFCIVFPKIQNNFDALYEKVTMTLGKGRNQLLDAIEQYRIGELPVTDGKVMGDTVEYGFKGPQAFDHFQRLRACIDAFPKIIDYAYLSKAVSKMSKKEEEVLNFILSHYPGLPFKDTYDLTSTLSHLKDLSFKNSIFKWGWSDLLASFKKDVIDAFPQMKDRMYNTLKSYMTCKEAWQFMKRNEPFSKEALGLHLVNYAKEFNIDQFKNSSHRDIVLGLFQHIQRTFKILPNKHLMSTLKILHNGEKILDLISKLAPDAIFYFAHNPYALVDLLNTLSPLKDKEKIKMLTLFQRHLQNDSSLNIDVLSKISLDTQESILNHLDEIDILDEIPNYISLVTNLSEIEETKRAQHLRLYQRHLQHDLFLDFALINKIPLDTQESILNHLDEIDILDEIPNYISLVKNLSKIEETKRAQHLRLYQRHLEYAKEDISQLILIPAEEQESILNLLDGVGFQGKLRNYKSVVKKLSQLPLKEQEVLFSKNGKLHAIFKALKTKKNKVDFFESFINLPKFLQPLTLTSFEILLERLDSHDFQIDNILLRRLALIPSSLLSSIELQEQTVEGIFQELAKPKHREALSEHLISLLDEAASDRESLRELLNGVENIKYEMRLEDEDSPLRYTIIRYKALLSHIGKVNPWTIFQDHKKRLASDEKLPLPSLGHVNRTAMLFDYEKLQSVSATADKLPKGIDFAKLQGLTKAFLDRFNELDEPRKNAILSYLREALPSFQSMTDLINTINEPWWKYNLRAPDSDPVSNTTWKLVNAVAYIAQENNEASMTLPGVEDTPENFDLKEKLLSPQERALLMLLGQVQYCDSGKEGGLEQFATLQPGVNVLSGAVQERISEAIITYLQREVIGSNAFLDELIEGGTSQPYHAAQYIRNVLSKELKFPLKFDAHTGVIKVSLLEKTPEELLNAVFANIDHPRLYQMICEQLNEFDWSSQEGIELFQSLRKRVPPDELLSCCKFDEDDDFIGITEKAVPYVLIQYGFFSKA